MQLLSKINKEIHFLLCVIDICTKYAFKRQKRHYNYQCFSKNSNESNLIILNESNHKPNKIWVDKGSEFYNRLMKSWQLKNDVEMYSTHN